MADESGSESADGDFQHQPVKDVESEGDLSEVDKWFEFAEAGFAEEAKEEKNAANVGAEIAGSDEMEGARGKALFDLKDMLGKYENRQTGEEENDSEDGMEVWRAATEGQGKYGSGAEELELNKAVDPDGGGDICADVAEPGEGDVGDEEHRDREEDGAGAVEVFTD